MPKNNKVKVVDRDHAGAEMIGQSLLMYPLWRRMGDFWYPDVRANQSPCSGKPVLVIPADWMEELFAEGVVLHQAGKGRRSTADERVADDLLTEAVAGVSRLWRRGG